VTRRQSSDVDAATYTRRRFVVAATVVAMPALLYAQVKARGERTIGHANLEPTFADTTTVDRIPTQLAGPLGNAAVVTSIDLHPAVAAFDHDVAFGASGTNVALLQDRLRQLGFDPGPTDRLFGAATQRAVWAYEKFILNIKPSDVTGVVKPLTWKRMNEAPQIRPRRQDPGTHLEILLDQQVAVLYIANAVRLITHISSGSGNTWCAVVLVDQDDGTQTEAGICGVAETPGGVFHFQRRFNGWRNSKLGRLYNPVYFNYGLAVHGALNVPKFPASHGCVRIPMHIAEYFPTLVVKGDSVYVFDGVQQPETYGAQVPTFDYPDPSYIPPTSTSTALPAPQPMSPTAASTATHADSTSR
jgi:peptidoglycan hydrolase-like protein with peptidoglycan-binding domain